MEFAVAALFAALAGMGVGGGGLLVIYLTTVLGMDQKIAQGVNLCFFIIASVAALTYYIGRKKINYPLVLFCAVVGCAFSVLGSSLAAYLPSHLLKKSFGVFMAIAGIITLVKTFRRREKSEKNSLQDEGNVL